MDSPFAQLMTPPKRRRVGSSRLLGRVLGTLGVLFAVLLCIGFGVQQQAHHQIIPSTVQHTGQHS